MLTKRKDNIAPPKLKTNVPTYLLVENYPVTTSVTLLSQLLLINLSKYNFLQISLLTLYVVMLKR